VVEQGGRRRGGRGECNSSRRQVHYFAPTLFCELVVLAGIGLWVLGWKHPPKRVNAAKSFESA